VTDDVAGATESVTEEWRPVPGFVGYEVSDQGRVRSLLGREPLILRPYTRKTGYRHVVLHGKTRFVHHLVLEAFVGPRPDGQECRHLDGQSGNNERGNLCWGTRAEQTADKARHAQGGRGPTPAEPPPPAPRPRAEQRCSQGHVWDEANTIWSRGRRVCRACLLDRRRAWDERQADQIVRCGLRHRYRQRDAIPSADGDPSCPTCRKILDQLRAARCL
jgi:hypothetical protein